MLYATLWKLWLERNNRVFRNKSNYIGEVDSIVWSLSVWVRNRKKFEGVDLNDLNRSWTAILVGGGMLNL